VAAGPQQPPPPNIALPLYADMAQQLLDEEDDRKNSIEQKGSNVLTTSGLLVTLLFAFASLARPQLTVSGAPLLLLAASLVAFVVASIFSVSCQWLLSYPMVPAHTIHDLVLNWWDKPYDPAQRRLAEAKAGILARARVQNARKGLALIAAQSFQILGILLAGIAVLTIMFSSPSNGASPSAKASPSPVATATK
jgi:hypothetical protein